MSDGSQPATQATQEPTKAGATPSATETPIKTDPSTGKELMHIKLYSPFQVYYNQDAFSMSGINDTGPFDILPRHHNFMTLLGESDLIIRSPGGEKKVKIARGVMHVKANKVTVFLDV